MSAPRGILRVPESPPAAADDAARPTTRRGLPRVNAPTPAPPPPRHDTAPQAPRLGFRLRAVTPLPRDTMPFSTDTEATLSYDGQTLARGFDLEARRQSTMPLSSAELGRLGLRESQAIRPAPRDSSERDTRPTFAANPTLPIPESSNVVPLPSAGRPRADHPLMRAVDLDLDRARHENDPARQSALYELSGLSRPSILPWLIAGVGVGLGALGLVFGLG